MFNQNALENCIPCREGRGFKNRGYERHATGQLKIPDDGR